MKMMELELALSEANVARAEAMLKLHALQSEEKEKKPEAKINIKESNALVSKLLTAAAAAAASGGGGGAAASLPKRQQRSGFTTLTCQGACGKNVSMPNASASIINSKISEGYFKEFICNECYVPAKVDVACTNPECDVIIPMSKGRYQSLVEMFDSKGQEIENDFKCNTCLYSKGHEEHKQVGKMKKESIYHREPKLEKPLSRAEFVRDIKEGSKVGNNGLIPCMFYQRTMWPPQADGKPFPESAKFVDVVATFNNIFIHKSPTGGPEKWVSALSHEEYAEKILKLNQAKQAAEAAAAAEDEDEDEDEGEGEEETA